MANRGDGDVPRSRVGDAGENQRKVIVGGYAFDKPEILAPLHAVMVRRGVSATFFVDIESGARPEDAEEFATAAIDRFFREVWTFGSPKPHVFYDPRTAIRGNVSPGVDRYVPEAVVAASSSSSASHSARSASILGPSAFSSSSSFATSSFGVFS